MGGTSLQTSMDNMDKLLKDRIVRIVTSSATL